MNDPNTTELWYRTYLPENICQRCNRRRAIYEVFNATNTSQGFYCGACSRILIIASVSKKTQEKNKQGEPSLVTVECPHCTTIAFARDDVDTVICNKCGESLSVRNSNERKTQKGGIYEKN